MGALDVLLLAAIAGAAYLALRACKKGKTGGCSGDCAHCGKNCKK